MTTTSGHDRRARKRARAVRIYLPRPGRPAFHAHPVLHPLPWMAMSGWPRMAPSFGGDRNAVSCSTAAGTGPTR